MVNALVVIAFGAFIYGCWLNAHRPMDSDTRARRALDRTSPPLAVKKGRVYRLHDARVREWEEWARDERGDSA